MRVFLAAMFVFVGVLLAVLVLSLSGWFDRLPVLLISIGVALYFLFLCAVALILFNAFQRNPRPGIDFDTIKQLEAKGLLEETPFHAIRAFEVEEIEDEGPHYFIELEDGSVLYLNGQYLYDDFEEIGDVGTGANGSDDNDSGRTHSRRFPCTEFTLRRHRDEGWVVDIECRGTPLEPESVEPAVSLAFDQTGWIPADGEIIVDRTYDAIREAMRAQNLR